MPQGGIAGDDVMSIKLRSHQARRLMRRLRKASLVRIGGWVDWAEVTEEALIAVEWLRIAHRLK